MDVEIAEEGDIIELEDDLTLEIINPPIGTDGDSIPENKSSVNGFLNNMSMVIKMTYKEKVFLFTGDIHFGRENELVRDYGEELEADVLVAPHHGHETSSSKRFIHTVNPDIVTIPSNMLFSEKIYNDYAEIADVYHTYHNGNVVLVTDGETIDVYTEKDKDETEE